MWLFRRIFSYGVLFAVVGSSAIAPAQIGSDEIFPNGRRSDGCTLIPDGHIKPCCLVHDQEYFRGGTRHERKISDKKLYDCVKTKKGFQHKIFAPFIWLGVRIGGIPFLPTRFRWGFGTKEQGYTKKSAAVTKPSSEN